MSRSHEACEPLYRGDFSVVSKSKPCLIVVGEKQFFLYNVDLRNYIRIRF